MLRRILLVAILAGVIGFGFYWWLTTPEEIAASLKPKFPEFTKETLLTDLEYGGTPLSRAR